jgi:hypothetical protein
MAVFLSRFLNGLRQFSQQTFVPAATGAGSGMTKFARRMMAVPLHHQRVMGEAALALPMPAFREYSAAYTLAAAAFSQLAGPN